MNHTNIRCNKHNIGRRIGLTICILLVSASLTAALDATTIKNINNNHLSYSFAFIEPELQTAQVNSSQYTTLQMSGCMAIGKQDGNPMLPVKSVKLLIPAMTTVNSVTVTGVSVELTSIETPIYPYQNPVPFGFEPEEFQFNTVLYTSDEVYPSTFHDGYHVGYSHGYAILDITLNPVQYIPGDGRLFYCPEITVTINLEETEYVNPFFRDNPDDKSWVENLVYNPEITDSYTNNLLMFDYSGGLCDPSDDYDYVIITTTYNGLDYWQTNSSIPYNWTSLMDKHEIDDNLKCTIVTIQDITACSDYHSSDPMFNDIEAHIREFCKDAYQDWGTQYIFIGGDDEWIPARHMKYLFEGDVDSDIYWSNLDNTFNNDHDNYWGEEGDSGFDLYAEMYIGRITCDTPQDVSNWMTKSFYYADATERDYLENAVFYGGNTGWPCEGDDFIDYSAIKGTDNWLGPNPGEHGEYPANFGFQYGFETWNSINPSIDYNLSVKWTGEPPNSGWVGGSESVAINGLKNAINNDQVTLISGIAHANEQMSLDVGMSSWESDYHNTKPFFIYDWGCHCGDMDAADDGVLHSMLFHSDTELAFACVYNTCFGWGSFYDTNTSSALQQKLFWDYLFDTLNNSGSTMNWQMGKAMTYSKDSMASTINWGYDRSFGSWRGIIQGCLLFGDPAQRIKPSAMLEHNVGIQTLDIDASNPVKPNKIIHVNATIYNSGENNETNVNVSFRVNGLHENSTNISLFESQTTQQVSFNWTPSAGSYIVTINVTIPGVTEGNYLDNEKNTTAIIGIQNIDTSELFNTIQEAINDSDTLDGHSILVPSGTYQENIMMNKNLSLLGVNRDTTIIKSNESPDSVIQIQNMDSVNISHLTIKDGTYGIYIKSSSNITIADSTVFNNTAIGIYLNLSKNIFLINNEISNNTVGINMTNSSNNTLTENDIMNNTKGLTIDSGSNNNSIYHNNFNNNQNAIDDGNNNSWDNGYLNGFRICGGNWWSDYDGSDEFSGHGQDVQGSDGVGDTPYDIAGECNSQDRYPLMEQWDGLFPGTIFVDADNTEGPWYGTPEHPYQYIQDGVDNATVECDIVFVYNGTYDESVTLDWQQKIDVIGENKETTIINASGYGNDAVIITGTSKGINISGFTITSDNGNGINIDFSYYNTIFGNNIINSDYGVYIYMSDNNDITGNTITNNNMGIGLYVFSNNNNIINCDVYNNSYGINLHSSSSNNIINCDVYNNSYGISLLCSSSNNIINCDVYNNSYGIHLSFSPYPHNNNNNIIIENTFTNNNYGVFIISFFGDSDGNQIYHNNIINNNDGDIPAYDECNNIWNDDYPYGGSYWDDYNGSDNYHGPDQNISGSDGIGDMPYNISGGDNQDRYPLMIPWGTIPKITNVSSTPDAVGFGFNVTISADVIGSVSTIDVNVTYPDDTIEGYPMNHTTGDTYEYNFSDTWLVGQYNYTIWAVDNAENTNVSLQYSFNVSANATISIATLKDRYGPDEDINITDPPGPPKPISDIGYELFDDNSVLHIWNAKNDYYFNTSSGIQLTNHYNEYWSHNVLMLGYYNNDVWNLIYRTDELNGFNKDIETDNETYLNATLWKDLSYGDYNFRLALRYHLGVDDSDLTIIPYIKNLGVAIPYTLGFGWEIKDIKIDNTVENDQIRINGTSYLLNQTLDNKYTNITRTIYEYNETTNTTTNYTVKNGEFYLENINNATGKANKDLYLKWNPDLNYIVQVKSRGGQYNAPVTLFIKVGTLDVGHDKSTELHWHDATLIDSYSESNESIWTAAQYLHPSDTNDRSAAGQSFTCSVNSLITAAKFYLYGVGSPTGMVHAVLYAHSGTYGTSSIPTGAPLATSDDFDISILTGSPTLFTLNFTGAEQYEMQASTYYCIVWENPTTGTIDDSNYPVFGFDYTSPTHDGNWIDFTNGIWDPTSAWDLCFYVYGEEVAENTAPTQSGEVPENESIDISLTPTLNINVDDADDDTLTAYWYSNSPGSWVLFATNSSIDTSSGSVTIRQINSNFSNYSTTYYWSVNLTDGNDWTNETYHFTTGASFWLGVTGDNLLSFCGEDSGWELANALNGSECWRHHIAHDHWFILDLQESYNIEKMRARAKERYDPIDVNVYISETNGSWGTPVATNISEWQDTDEWVETDTADKIGRYIKIVVKDTESILDYLTFGTRSPALPIFDVYGDIAVLNTLVDDIIPYCVVSSPLNVMASGSSGLDNVTLWYRYSDDNSSWGSYCSFGVDDVSPWSWNFDFPDGTGYYEFYSIGKKSGLDDESPPVSADAQCNYRNQSKIKNDGSTDIKGHLLMHVQYYNVSLENWVVDQTPVDDMFQTIDSGTQLALDAIFNGLVNTNDLTNGDGTYRVYAAFRDPGGNVLVCDDIRKLEAWWEFEVDTS